MHIKEEQSFVTITRGYEQPSLEYGPQRLHYIYSVGIPQAYLTLFSILQGLVFSILLANIKLPQDLAWTALDAFLFQQHLYLPYIIGLGIIILIWLHLISVTLTGGWPHSFTQISLVTALTLFELLTVQSIAQLPLWLFFIGCVSLVGGVILIRTGLTHQPNDFDPQPNFQKFGVALKKWEVLRGRQYLLIGGILIVAASFYSQGIFVIQYWQPSFVYFVPWGIYAAVITLLTVMIFARSYRVTEYRETRRAMYASTDITISRGIARYNKNVAREGITLPTTSAQNEAFQIRSDPQRTIPLYQFLEVTIGLSIILFVILQWLLHQEQKRK